MKKIRELIAVILSFCLIFSLCACSDSADDPSERIIKYNIENEPITLDPQIANDSAAELIIMNIYEGLMRLDENDNPTIGVAESYTSNSDYTEYTFTVRSDAKWSDGSTLTAEDFRYGMVRALATETDSETAGELFCIKNAEKFHNGEAEETELGISISGNKIVFELEYSDEDFLSVLTLPPTMPCNKEFFASTQGQYGREDDMILSNGSFYVKKYGWSHGESIILRKNENYVGEKNPVPAGVDITIGENPDNAFEAVFDGTFDCYAISGSDYERAYEAGMTIKAYDDITWGICFNMDNDIMKNANIRKGFLTSLNRNNIENNIPEHYNYANGIVPETATVGLKNYRDLAGEMFLNQSDDAKQYFAKGLKELELTKLSDIEILCPDDEDIQPMVNEMIKAWNSTTGYYFNKNPVSRSELSNAVSSGNYSIVLAPLQSDGASPFNTLEKFRTNASGNIADLKSEEYDAFIDRIENSSDSDSINTIIEAEKYLRDNAIFYPICTETRYYASAPNITGIIFHQYGAEVDFRYATAVEGD